MPTSLVRTSRHGTFISFILARASQRRLPFSTPEVTRGMGMSLCTLQTRTHGGTRASSWATISTSLLGWQFRYLPFFHSSQRPVPRITNVGYILMPSGLKAGFSKNYLNDSRSRSIPILGRSGIIWLTTLYAQSLAIANVFFTASIVWPLLVSLAISSQMLCTPISRRVQPYDNMSARCLLPQKSGLVSMVIPMHLALLCSENCTASSWSEEMWPLSASCRFLMKQSRQPSSSDMNVPPMMINSTLSTSWPIFLSCSTRSLVWIQGLQRALMALIEVGSQPVYDCVEYSKSESGPPGQQMQMLPVVAMWGQRWGLHMTATTAMPLAVRTGLALSRGVSLALQFSGMALMISTSLGALGTLLRRVVSLMSWCRFTFVLFSQFSTRVVMISEMFFKCSTLMSIAFFLVPFLVLLGALELLDAVESVYIIAIIQCCCLVSFINNANLQAVL